LGGGVLMLKTALIPVPDFASLVEFSAPVKAIGEAEEPRRDPRPWVRFEGRNGTYFLPRDLKDQDAILANLETGAPLRAWSDVGKSYTLWQIESGSQLLVDYESSRAAAVRRRWMSALLGMGLLGLPFFHWGLAIRRHQKLLRDLNGKV
jgi:hypothetical protein